MEKVALVVVSLVLSVFLYPEALVTKETGGAGFFLGIAHGLSAFFNFIGSLFFEHVAIYEAYNAGARYDFGYLLGMAFFSSFIIRISNRVHTQSVTYQNEAGHIITQSHTTHS